MDEQAEVLTFLEDCHEHLSNKFKNPEHPLDALRQYEWYKSRPYEWYDPGKLEPVWFRYLDLKFSYLLTLDRDEAEADRMIESEARNFRLGDLHKFWRDWKKNAHAEQVAYIYRVLQLPDESVHAEWYYQGIDPCQQWCRAQQDKLYQLESTIKKCVADNRVTDIFDVPAPKAFAESLSEERRLDIITKIAIQGSANRILNIQKGWSIPPSNAVGKNTDEYDQFSKNVQRSVTQEVDLPRLNESCPFEHKFLLDLYLNLITALISQNFNETEVIRQFLHEIKKKFDCEICDYLDVDASEKKLTWRVATLHFNDLSEEYQKRFLEEDITRRTQREESYNKGQGITGSILLLDAAKGKDMWYHVGSNDVQHDPRQSEQHRSTYEEGLYPNALKVSNGLIQNFWAFPVFIGSKDEEKLVGAFRVVNKLDGERTNVVGWTYTARVQLSIIADWFSRFLERIRPHVGPSEDFIAVLKRDKQFGNLVERLGLSWVENQANLRGLIRHLSRDVGKKIEHRNVGCCIFIAKQTDGSVPLASEGNGRGLDSYPLIRAEPGIVDFPYDKLDNYHDAVNPLMGAFVFNQEGKFIRIIRLQKGERSGVDLIKKTTLDYPESVCLLLMRGAKNVLIYKGGKRAAEISISEGTGEWQFRYPEEIFKTMKKGAPDVKEEVLRTVLDACLEMSNKAFGGLFVLGKIPNADTLFTFSKPKIDYRRDLVDIQSLGVDALVEFAKMDGATFIDADGIVRQINVTVRANEAKPEPSADAQRQPQSETQEQGVKPEARDDAQVVRDENTEKRQNGFQGRGARHETGWLISLKAPESLVIIVSENRGISIVHGGGASKYESL